jgi:F-type H+-transporting ATPase subunit gamma
MGADIKSLRVRMKSVDSTLHLTKAMGLVASSKIRRATEAMNKSKEYKD